MKYLHEITGGELTIWKYALKAQKMELSDDGIEANLMTTESCMKV